MRIQNNLSAIFANRQLSITNSKLEKSLQKLSSGYRINYAADDAAGLAISEKMRGQIGGLQQAQRNIMDSISLIQTAEGGMEEISVMLQRLRTLAVQAANDTYTSIDRGLIQTEIEQILAEVDRMTTGVQFNAQSLLDGTVTSFKAQAGANKGQIVTLDISTMSGAALGITGISVTTQAAAESAIGDITTAINRLSTARANLGSFQNRLQHTYNYAGVSIETITASESRIRDTDMAAEMVDFTKNQILTQAGTAMLTQANFMPRAILALFQ